MLSKIRLVKFQGFDKAVDFKLRPLTLIFGPNASGKSSIIRSLLLLKQSIATENSHYSRSVSGFTFDGADISLASFANVVHRHSESDEIEIEIGIDDFASSVIRSGPVSNHIEKASVTFRIGIKPPLNSMEIRASLSGFTEELRLDFAYSHGSLNLQGWDGLSQLDELKLPSGYGGQSAEIDDVVGFIDWPAEVNSKNGKSTVKSTWEEIASGLTFKLRNNFPSLRGAPKRTQFESKKIRQLDDLITSVEIALSKQLREIRHVGPLRTISERLSYQAGLVEDEAESVQQTIRGKTSEEIVSDWLFALTDERYKFQPVEFYADQVKFLGSLKSQIIIDTKTDTPVTFADVGVGLSQVLPILQAMQTRRKKPVPTTLLIEQPELHLHPAMQANLADLFVKAVSGHTKLQIVAETHSESMLLRIQKRLREGKLKPTDVQILYVDGGELENKVSEVYLDAEDEFSLTLPLSFSALRLKDLL